VLADKILELRRLDGVTYSGGEPFAQANGLAYLGEILQANGLSIVCFTGYRLDEVRAANRLDWNRLLSVTDLLVDGPYMRDRKTTMPLRGSSNQRIHFLTRRFVDHPELKENTAKRFEIHLTTEGKMQVTGFPEFDLGELQKRLRSHGICVR
jgi:anaerobic ribonucleoside-triphosphate reductase activating protein